MELVIYILIVFFLSKFEFDKKFVIKDRFILVIVYFVKVEIFESCEIKNINMKRLRI